MKLILGTNNNGSLALPESVIRSTHMLCAGSTGMGKSSFLELMARNYISAGYGVTILDWHSPLFYGLRSWCANKNIGRKFFGAQNGKLKLLDLAQGRLVLPFNPFVANNGADISVEASNIIAATIRGWGITNSDEMKMFEREFRMLALFMLETGQNLINASKLLEFQNEDLRKYALSKVSNPFTRSELLRLNSMSFREFDANVLSSQNRLVRFLCSSSIRRYMSLTEHNIDPLELMETDTSLLVNLGDSDNLSRESARVFGSIFVYQYLHAALKRASRYAGTNRKPKPHILILDEAQHFLNPDTTDMLSEVRKGGLHVVIATQFMSRFAETPGLLDSVLTNCGVKVAFGGNTTAEAELLATEIMLDEIVKTRMKQQYYRLIHRFEEQTRNIESESSTSTLGGMKANMKALTSSNGYVNSQAAGQGQAQAAPLMLPSGDPQGASLYPIQTLSEFSQGGFADAYGQAETEAETSGSNWNAGKAKSLTKTPFLKPIEDKELSHETEYSIEEKTKIAASLIKHQQKQHCLIRIANEPPQQIRVLDVAEYPITNYVIKYAQDIQDQAGAVTAIRADEIIAESERKLLEAVRAFCEISSNSNGTKPKARKQNIRKKVLNPWP
jgi:hypothetical protein